MSYAILSGSVRKAVVLGAVGAVILVAGNPIGAAPPPTQVPNSPASEVLVGVRGVDPVGEGKNRLW